MSTRIKSDYCESSRLQCQTNDFSAFLVTIHIRTPQYDTATHTTRCIDLFEQRNVQSAYSASVSGGRLGHGDKGNGVLQCRDASAGHTARSTRVAAATQAQDGRQSGGRGGQGGARARAVLLPLGERWWCLIAACPRLGRLGASRCRGALEGDASVSLTDARWRRW